jgi:hypothetical protein
MSWEEDARRVAEIFGVPAGQRLPAVSRQTLRHYHTYLTAHLVFPFHAAIEDLDGVVTVQSLFTLKECPDLTVYEQHLDNLRRKDSLGGAETAQISVRLGNLFRLAL